ncbi:MAG: AEC family transporter [Haloarculaceae archaeon]
MSAISAFTSAILPIVAIAAVGYLIGVRTDVSVDALNTVALNFFLPALVFHGVATTELGGGTVLWLAGGVLAYLLAMMGIGYVAGRALDLSEAVLPGVVLSSSFPNSGFVGIPLSGFVFGDLGTTTATIYLTVQSVLLYTLGVYFVSASTGAAADPRDALREVFRLPLVYAVALAALVRVLGVVPPVDGTLMTTIDAVGSASIPVMLTVVGIQLSNVDLSAFRRTALPAALKLAVAPAVGLVIALAIGFSDPRVGNVFVLECATPAAVTPLAITIAYSDTAENTVSTAEYVSSVIFVTTVLSVVVLTGLVVAVRNGLLL